MENEEYGNVIGAGSDPFINRLAGRCRRPSDVRHRPSLAAALDARRGARTALRRNAVFIPGDFAVLTGLIIVAAAYGNSL